MPAYSSIPTPLEISRRDELSTKIMLYQGTRAARRRMETELEELGRRRNILLPLELMEIIFDFYVHLYAQLPERLLLVCHAWHVLALSQPKLWTNLDPLGPFGFGIIRPWAGTFIQSRIARSKVDFSSCSPSILLEDMQKIAAIRTFRPRIQALVVAYTYDLFLLIGDQPLLKHLTFGALPAYFQFSTNPVEYKLFDKAITTLRLRCPTWPLIWPELLLRRLRTLEVTVTGDVGSLQQYWAMVQKSAALLTLHITMRSGSAPSLSHASCRNLTVAYCDGFCSLEEVRMPHLQKLTIVTHTSNALMRLVDAPISVLQLTCKFPHADKNQAIRASWVKSAIRLLHSAPRLERFEIFAPFDLITTLAEALAEDLDLCRELHSFIINGSPETELEAVGYAHTNAEAKFEQLRNNVAAFIDQRRLRRSKN